MIASTVATHESFERGFLREYPDVVRCAYRILGDRTEAEDVAQDVFVRFMGRALPDAGVLRVTAVRLSLNALRSTKRRVARELNEYRAARTASPQPLMAYWMSRGDTSSTIRTSKPRWPRILVMASSLGTSMER